MFKASHRNWKKTIYILNKMLFSIYHQDSLYLGGLRGDHQEAKVAGVS